jgi:ribonuclease HI
VDAITGICFSQKEYCMTNEILASIGSAYLRERDARTALTISEGRGQRQQARDDRAELAAASRALEALVAQAEGA